MYKLPFGFLLLVALTGCGVDHKGAPDEALERELKTQLQNDLNKIGKRIDFGGVKFYFFTDAEIRNGVNVHGFCSSNHFEKAISLYKDPVTLKLYVNFVHEIGHCYYGRGHTDGVLDIMNTRSNLELLLIFGDTNETDKLQLLKNMTN